MTHPDRYLTIPDVAAILGVDRSTVYRYIADGLFGTLVNIGRKGQSKTRIPQSQLDKFIAERTRRVDAA
jgi:excisionase family DNA binding protein